MFGLLATDASTAVINADVVAELINLSKTCMGLFSSFPMNVLLVASLVGIGFSIFRNAKRSVRQNVNNITGYGYFVYILFFN